MLANAPNQRLLLREWAPLTELFAKLPQKTGGIFSQDIKLTCLDALSEFLVLGTNVGIIFWYDRKKNNLQRLRCESSNSPITYVKAVSTVDYMIASGNSNGNITIFQIPKTYPDNLPENWKPQQKQVERYTVTDLHTSRITALEWSKNGMKLFSGDKTGGIVMTEIDFYMHVCKSLEILNESYEVVQLSYKQQYLLVSTTFRSIICHYENKWKVCQVGKKDRKVLDRFGGIIRQQGFKPSNSTLYCMRPGLRIWLADIEGNVNKTLLFKDILCRDCVQVPLLNPISKALLQLKPQKEAAFGVVREFCDNLLVTYSNDVVYVLDPDNMSVLAMVNNLRGILDVTAYKDEMFILEDDRSLLRISYQPEYIYEDLNTSVDSPIVKAEEAEECLTQTLTKSFDEISKLDFDDNILFKKTKRKTAKKVNPKAKVIAEEEWANYTKPTLMNLSCVGIVPDLRSPETLAKDIEEKEKLLSDILNLDQFNIPLDLIRAGGTAATEPEAEPVTEETDRRGPAVRPSTSNEPPKSTAQIVNIPNDWKISNIEMFKEEPFIRPSRIPSNSIPILGSERRRSSNTDSSLSDWEII